MNKEQLKNEVNNRIEILKSYLGQVQKIENYKYDIECQSYFPMINNTIIKMRKRLELIMSKSDTEFKEFNIANYIKDLDNMMNTPKCTLEHIKSKGLIPKPLR